jgi:hypothetical protein
MSVPDPDPPRKPRRFWLYFPFVLTLIGAAAWSVAWAWARDRVNESIAEETARLRNAGYELSWRDQTVGGYPFRLDVTLLDASIRDPAGWGLSSPRFEAESYMLTPGHWMMATPDGLTFTRPRGGPVAVTGKLLHASVSQLDRTPPAFSFEGVKLAFAPEPGAAPFALAGAERVEVHLRAGPDDEGGVFLRVDKGAASPVAFLGRVADGKPVAMALNATLSRVSGLKGAGWAEAARRWSEGGGQINLREAGVTASDAALRLQPGKLSVGSDGRLRGSLDMTLTGAAKTIDALGAGGVIPPEAAVAAGAVAAARLDGGAVRARLNFEAGVVTFGPVSLGPAPKVY